MEQLQRINAQRLANGLGWFSIGLGVGELVAPGQMARLIGVNDDTGNRKLLRAYGVREIAAGVGILSQTRPAGWVWSRVAGDMLDLASLGSALNSDDSNRTRVAAATAAVVGVTVLDILCGKSLSDGNGASKKSKYTGRVSRSTIIERPREVLYEYWQDFTNAPFFMENIESVRDSGNGRSHWKATEVGGVSFEWDAQVTQDQPNSTIAWQSLPGSELQISGSVTFQNAIGKRGTLVRVEMEYALPGGGFSEMIAKLFGKDPATQIEKNLRRLKQIMETGEIVQSDASIHPGMHAAQPSSNFEETVMAH